MTRSATALAAQEIPANPPTDEEPRLIDRARLLEAIEFQSLMATAGTGPDVTMRVVTEQAQHLTKADGAVIELISDDEMVSRAASGAAKGSLGARLKASGSMSGLALSTGQVHSCADSETDIRVNRRACRKVGLRSMLYVPIAGRGVSVGVLEVFSSRVDAFDETDIAVLRLLAGLIAAALTQAELIEQLSSLARTDSLTSLPNRRAFEEEATRQLSFAKRRGHPLCFALLDFDHFKKYNELHGHPAGDWLIREATERWRSVLRNEDLIGRWGGEEFAILLPNCTTDNAVRLCWRLREETPGEQTFSAGLVSYHGTETLEELVARADVSLYQAKAKGRGRTVAENLVDLD